MLKYENRDEQEHVANILIVDNNKEWQTLLKGALMDRGYQIEVAGSHTEAKDILNKKSFDLAIIEIQLSGDWQNRDGLKVITEIRNTGKPTNIIIFSGAMTEKEIPHVYREYKNVSIIFKFEGQKIFDAIEQSIPKNKKSKYTFLNPKNYFLSMLLAAIDLYSNTQKQMLNDVLDEMNDQLGYGRRSMTIQKWLQENTIPNSAEVEYFAKKITETTNLDFEWVKKFYAAAGYKVPEKLTNSEVGVIGNSFEVVGTAINSNIIMNYINPNEQPADIFVSYARTDIKIVKSVYRSLKNKKHKPWMDVYSIKGGENWFRAISKAIDECEIFLAVLSNNSVSRRGVIQKELKKAMDKWEGMLPDDIYILPLRIDDCPIPELLKDLHVIDWDNGKGRKKLLDAISVGLARRKARG